MSTGQPLVGKTGTPLHTVSVASCPHWPYEETTIKVYQCNRINNIIYACIYKFVFHDLESRDPPLSDFCLLVL